MGLNIVVGPLVTQFQGKHCGSIRSSKKVMKYSAVWMKPSVGIIWPVDATVLGLHPITLLDPLFLFSKFTILRTKNSSIFIKKIIYSIVLVLAISFSFYCPRRLTLFIHLVNCSSIPCFSALNSYRIFFKSSFWRFKMVISEDMALTSEVFDFLKIWNWIY